jgi:hypothetical protein
MVGRQIILMMGDIFAPATLGRHWFHSNAPRLIARETSPLGHRLGLASLMDGTVPPLPSNYRPFLLRDRNSWAETTPRATSASFIPEWKPRNGSKNIRQGRSFYFVVASE